MDPKHTLITSRPGGHRSESGLQRLETDAGEDVSVCGDAEMDRRPVHVESVRPPPVHVEYAAAIHQPEERNNNNKPQHSKKKCPDDRKQKSKRKLASNVRILELEIII